MISLEQIRNFFPPYLREDPIQQKYLLKEYLQLMILDFLSNTPFLRKMTLIRGCGFFFPSPVPPDEILCAMKITALLSRRKGRDFYDVMFLMDQVKPDYTFLSEKVNIQDMPQLKTALLSMLTEVDLKERSRDFRHLLLNKENAKKILHFEAYIQAL